MDTFGEYLLAHNVTKKASGYYACYNVNLGLSKGDALALSGLKRHGRLDLCNILAGYDTPSDGTVWSMSKWRSDTQPHMVRTYLPILKLNHINRIGRLS